MLARRGDIVTRRKILEDLDIGYQTRTGEYPFQQVVAQNGVFRNSVRKRGLEGIDLINTLAAIGAFLKQILIDVRYCLLYTSRCV